MELPNEGIYCVAKATDNNIIQATALLPYPINLSKRKAEVAVKYIAVTPTWKHFDNLYAHVIDNDEEDATPVAIHFDEVVDTDGVDIIQNLREQLEILNKSKSSKPLLSIKKHKSGKFHVFKLRKKAACRFSPALAQLFGVRDETEQSYISSDDKDMDIRIVFREDTSCSTTDIYYLKSEEIASNFFLDSKQDSIIELLHIPGTETVDFHPMLTYSLLEVRLLEKLTFTLYNEKNHTLSSNHTDLYVVCHIRPRNEANK